MPTSKLPKRVNNQKLGKKAADLCNLLLSEFCNVLPVLQEQDIGIDFICEVMNGEHPTGQQFNVQCKGANQKVFQRDSVSRTIKVSTLNYWLCQPIPTFLVLVDCDQEILYWSFPASFLSRLSSAWQEQETVSIPIPIENRIVRDSRSLPELLLAIVKRHKSAKPHLDYGETLSLSYSSIIIDGIFVSDVILETVAFYSELYPSKDLKIPSIYAVINQLLEWSRFPQDRQVRCYLIMPHEDVCGVSGIVDRENEERI